MNSSLIPEKPLLISPSLAVTIGLEEACMLAVLNEAAHYLPARPWQGHHWFTLDNTLITRLMPFWNAYDIDRVSRNLKDKGIILLQSAPFTSSGELQVAFNEQATAQRAAAPAQPAIASANRIAPSWQPDQELLRRLAELNIPEAFAMQQLPEFITYWREKGDISHAWGSRFLKDVVYKWRQHQSQTAREQRELREQQDTAFLNRDLETPMHSQWRPSRDALEVLVKHASISLAFVEDAIPEFILFWKERGDVGKTWNSKFIQHVKRQWARYTSALEHDTEPRRIPENWSPGAEVFDVLRLANIDLEFAKRQIPEFQLYWRESNQVYASWNTKFLQHVKYHWAKQHALATLNSQQVDSHAGNQSSHPATSTRDRSLLEDLTDRSWAQ